MVDDVPEEANVLIRAAELLAGSADAAVQGDRFEQRRRSDVLAGSARAVDVLGGELRHRLGERDHLADDRDAWLELRDVARDDGIGGVGQVEEAAGLVERLAKRG